MMLVWCHNFKHPDFYKNDKLNYIKKQVQYCLRFFSMYKNCSLLSQALFPPYFAISYKKNGLVVLKFLTMKTTEQIYLCLDHINASKQTENADTKKKCSVVVLYACDYLQIIEVGTQVTGPHGLQKK